MPRGQTATALQARFEQELAQLGDFSPRQTRFIIWLATPESERHPKTQRELAETLRVTEQAVSIWKRKRGLGAAARRLADRFLDSEWPAILHKFAAEARRGSVPHFEALAKVRGEWPTAGHTIIGDKQVILELGPEQAQALERVARRMEKAREPANALGYGQVASGFEPDEEPETSTWP
jgi:hypothetical protein